MQDGSGLAETLEERLVQAIRRGDTATVRAIIDAGADLGYRLPSGSPITFAATKGEILELLLERGADPNARAGKGRTILHIEATASWDGVATILRHGADVNARDNDGRTPLFYVAFGESPDVVEVLVASGAEIEARDEDGCTALYCAAAFGRIATTEALLRHGALVDAMDNDGETPLAAACRIDIGATLDVVTTLLIHGADVNAESNNGFRPIHYAAMNGNEQVIRRLLASGGRKVTATKFRDNKKTGEAG